MRRKENRANDKYLSKVQLCDCDDKSVFYDKLTYYYLEMPKFRKKETELATHLDYWLYYLNNLASMTEIPTILKQDNLLQEACEVAEFLALDKDEKISYQRDVKARWDNKACLDFSIEKGIEQGIERGAEKEKIEIAKNLLKAKMDLSFICKTTGLSEAVVKKLTK